MKTYKEFKQDISIDERYDKDLDADGNGKLTKRDFALLRKKKKKTDCMEAAEKPSSQYTTTSKGTFKTKNDPFYPEYDKHEQGKTSDAKKKKYAELGLKCEESEELDESTNWEMYNAQVALRKKASPEELHAEFKKHANNPGNIYYKGKFSDDKNGGKTAEQKAITNIALGIGKADKQNYASRISHFITPKPTNEEVEELEEVLDKETLGSYIKKAHDQLIKHTAAVNVKTGRGDPDAFAYSHEPNTMRKSSNRDKGIAAAVKKLTKEDLELALEMALSEEIEYKNPDDKLKHIHITRDKVTGKVTNINHTVSGKDGRNYDTDVDVNDNNLDKHLKDIKSAVGKTRISINGSRGEPIRIDSDNVDQHIKDIKDAHSGKKGLEQFSPAKTLPKGSVQRPIGDRDRHSGM